MNVFNYINELEKVITNNADNESNKYKMLTYKEHCSSLLNFLEMFKKEMESFEYNFVVETTSGKIKTFNEATILEKNLNNDIIIFQPTDPNITNEEIEPLVKLLYDLHEQGKIKQDILFL